MSTFDTNVSMVGITDRETGEKVRNIIKKYIHEPITQELCDKIIKDVQDTFGVDHPAEVGLDDKTQEIVIIVRDSRGRFIKCSSLALFPEEYL
jgi:hypothetical protein